MSFRCIFQYKEVWRPPFCTTTLPGKDCAIYLCIFQLLDTHRITREGFKCNFILLFKLSSYIVFPFLDVAILGTALKKKTNKQGNGGSNRKVYLREISNSRVEYNLKTGCLDRVGWNGEHRKCVRGRIKEKSFPCTTGDLSRHKIIPLSSFPSSRRKRKKYKLNKEGERTRETQVRIRPRHLTDMEDISHCIFTF